MRGPGSWEAEVMPVRAEWRRHHRLRNTVKQQQVLQTHGRRREVANFASFFPRIIKVQFLISYIECHSTIAWKLLNDLSIAERSVFR